MRASSFLVCHATCKWILKVASLWVSVPTIKRPVNYFLPLLSSLWGNLCAGTYLASPSLSTDLYAGAEKQNGASLSACPALSPPRPVYQCSTYSVVPSGITASA